MGQGRVHSGVRTKKQEVFYMTHREKQFIDLIRALDEKKLIKAEEMLYKMAEEERDKESTYSSKSQ